MVLTDISNDTTTHILNNEDDDDDELETSMTLDEALNSNTNSNKTSKNAQKLSKKNKRRRRRSSARFLRDPTQLQDLPEEDEEEDLHGGITQEQLTEIYNRAVRLNAENRINGQNTWGLNLIDNMERIVHSKEDEGNDDGATNKTGDDSASTGMRKIGKNDVNFTKASCTLDASIKIYSYRVDDVHLSSYKVLANMNRTTSSSSKNKNNDDDPTKSSSSKHSKGSSNNSALLQGVEHTLSPPSTLNINGLDLTYDVDPLFHKMSKSFDEGGARGLLLNNLSVGRHGCSIQFDSKASDEFDVELENDDYSKDETTSDRSQDLDNNDNHYHVKNEEDQKEERDEENTSSATVDITCLRSKLDSLLHNQPLHSLQLLPQLRSLRTSVRDAVDLLASATPRRSKHYSVPDSVEREAEVSIHAEALERSKSFVVASSDHHNPIRLAEEWDDNEDEGNIFDNDDDAAFDDFIAMDATQGSFVEQSHEQQKINHPVLDAICTSETLFERGDRYGYFHMDDLRTMLEDIDLHSKDVTNVWAGAQHWNRARRSANNTATVSQHDENSERTMKSKQIQKKNKKKNRLSSPEVMYLDFKSFGNDDSFAIPSVSSKTNKKKADPLQLGNSAKAKMSTEAHDVHLLPDDAHVVASDLAKLAEVPYTAMKLWQRMKKEGLSDKLHSNNKKVSFMPRAGFLDEEDNHSEGDFEYDNDTGGDDYDGGYLMENSLSDIHNNGNNMPLMHETSFFDVDAYSDNELDGVRKVDKVQVGYAKVAKKVDVKRLKKDLWCDLTDRMTRLNISDENVEKYGEDENVMEEPVAVVEKDITKISFQDVVRTMDGNQGQKEATLPFYFICILHLANEKGLKLDSEGCGLNDFRISKDGSVVV